MPKKKTKSASNHSRSSTPEAAKTPDVGEIIQRLRLNRELSLEELAEATGLSASFLSAVERGVSDIALKRLARVAEAFGHDVGSLLGYTARQAKPVILDSSQRLLVDRGRGIDYEVVRVPGVEFEFVTATFSPGAEFADEMAHEGVDALYIAEGTLTLIYNGSTYQLPVGSCAVYSGGYPHAFRNETKRRARMVGVVTESVY